MQQVLAQLQVSVNTPLPPATKRRQVLAKPKHGVPSAEWPNVMRRVIENKEPLRTVAEAYGVSHETIRRTVNVARRKAAL
ncbi:MAG: hypothetical protein NVS4B11_23240 [Ktedonobacteraceae bacterium]